MCSKRITTRDKSLTFRKGKTFLKYRRFAYFAILDYTSREHDLKDYPGRSETSVGSAVLKFKRTFYRVIPDSKETGKPFIVDVAVTVIERGIASSGYRRRVLRVCDRNGSILAQIRGTGGGGQRGRATPVARVCTAIGKRVMT